MDWRSIAQGISYSGPKAYHLRIATASILTVMVYGQTKIGKTTLCSQAEGALFLATEPGLNALDVFQVPILTWTEKGVRRGRGHRDRAVRDRWAEL
jgi:hypothetical protein